MPVDVKLTWNQALQRCDWSIVDGRLAADSSLETTLLFLLFTDRVAQPDYVPANRSNDRRGVWTDSFTAEPLGSRLYQLERRKIVDRGALEAETTGMLEEATAPLVRWGVAVAVSCSARCPPAGPGQPGTLLVLSVLVVQASGQSVSFSYPLTLS